MKKVFLTITFTLGAIVFLQGRTWTSSDGKKLQAEFLSATEREVTLKRDSDGKTFTLPLNRLSEFDQKFVQEQETQSVEGAAEEEGELSPIAGEYSHLITGDWVLAEHGDLPYAFYGGKTLDGSKKYPLVISLHGKSSNNENGKQIGQARVFAKPANYEKRPCLILAPLCYQPYGETGGGWDDAPGEETLDLIEELVKKLSVVDTDRVYVIGYSMGGFGTWHFLSTETKLFAAGVPIAGYGSDASKLRSMPIWSFHGAKDTVVGVDGARRCAEELKRSKVFKYTEYPEEGHGITGKVLGDEELHEWLFQQSQAKK